MGYFTTLPHSAPTDTVISAQTSCTPILDSFIVLFNIIASYSLHPENFWKHFFQTIEAFSKEIKSPTLSEQKLIYSSMLLKCNVQSITSPFWGKKKTYFYFKQRGMGTSLYGVTWSASWRSTSSVPQPGKTGSRNTGNLCSHWTESVSKGGYFCLSFFLVSTDKMKSLAHFCRLNRGRWCLERCDFLWKFEGCFVCLF